MNISHDNNLKTKTFTVLVSDSSLSVQCTLDDLDTVQIYNGDVLGENGFCFSAIVVDGEILERSPRFISAQVYAEIIERYYAA